MFFISILDNDIDIEDIALLLSVMGDLSSL